MIRVCKSRALAHPRAKVSHEAERSVRERLAEHGGTLRRRGNRWIFRARGRQIEWWPKTGRVAIDRAYPSGRLMTLAAVLAALGIPSRGPWR